MYECTQNVFKAVNVELVRAFVNLRTKNSMISVVCRPLIRSLTKIITEINFVIIFFTKGNAKQLVGDPQFLDKMITFK